jgi:hypothetical protein
MNAPYEILIRANGLITGAHAIDAPGGRPRPVAIADLASFGDGLNAAAIATLSEQAAAIATHDQTVTAIRAEKTAAVNAANAEKTAAIQERDAAVATLAEHQAISDALAKAAAEAIAAKDWPKLQTILEEATAFGVERERRKLAAEVAAKEAEAAALRAKLAAI